MAARRGSVIPLIIAGLLGLVLIIAVRQWMGGDDGATGATGDPTGSAPTGTQVPEGCTTVSIVASSEKAALLSTLAARYNGSSPQVDGACMWMSVSTKASGAAATALARGWDEKVDGVRPDVWSPASSSWAVLVDQGAADLDRPSPMPKERPSLVQTPLVIAMPLPMAQALGWPDDADRLDGPRGHRQGAEGMGEQGPPRVGPVQARQDQPVLLHLRAQRHDRVLLRGHRRLQRPHLRPGRRPRRPGPSSSSWSPRSSTTATPR